MKNILFILAFFTLSGCVGIGTIVSEDRYYKPGAILSEEPGVFQGRDNNKTYTKKEVIKIWGEPKTIQNKESKEYLVYNRELAWGGIFIYALIIPIPLFFPIGMRETTLIFKDDPIVSIISEGSRMPTVTCGPLMPMVTGDDMCSIVQGW